MPLVAFASDCTHLDFGSGKSREIMPYPISVRVPVPVLFPFKRQKLTYFKRNLLMQFAKALVAVADIFKIPQKKKWIFQE